MSITKLKSFGTWALPPDNLANAGATLGGRRVITGMLTGPDVPAPHNLSADETQVGHRAPIKGRRG